MAPRDQFNTARLTVKIGSRGLHVARYIGIGIGIGLLKIHIAASKAELHEITV